MREMFTQHVGIVLAMLCGVLVLLLGAFLSRRRRRGARPIEIARVVTTSGATADAPVERQVAGSEAEALVREDGVAGIGLDRVEIAQALEDAEKDGLEHKLPALHLALARCQIADGEPEAAAELLRKSILGAAKADDKATHAAARVLLGDIAHARGDATTACEHWQMARALFHELGNGDEHAAVEGRMLKNGCPTDWVLTDF